MSWTITGVIGAQPIDATSTTQNHALGTVVNAWDHTYGSGEFVYLKGVASTAVGSCVTYAEDDWSTALSTANATGQVAFAMSACVASNYGWYQIKGKAVTSAATVSDNGEVYLTATGGQLDDLAVSGDKVYRAKFASANGTPSTGLAEIEIDRPYVTNGLGLDSTEITASSAEINYLDITTLGTGAASKAVVLDGSSNWTSPGAGTIAMASGSTFNVAGTFQIGGTAVSATATEINRACDASARVVSVAATPLSVTEALHDGKLLVLNKADGATLTLPAATGSGSVFRIIVGTTVTSNTYVIQVADATDIMDGFVCTMDDTATPVPGGWVTASDTDTITLNGGTQGGIIGDEITLTDIATNQWVVHGFLKQSGTEATPFSAAVS